MATRQVLRPGSPRRTRAVASLASRDRLLAAAAILALVVAAFLAPPLDTAAGGAGAGPGPGPGDGNGTGTPSDQPGTVTPSDSGDGSPTDGTPIDVEPGEGGESGGDGQPTGEPGVSVRPSAGDRGDGDGGMNLTGTDPHPDCVLVVWDRLVPGDDATVFLWNDGRPVDGNAVWFDDRRVAATNRAGRADGPVPYVRELNVTAAAPPEPECAALHLQMDTDFDRWQADRDASPELVLDEDAPVETVPTTGGNASVTLPVVGNASIAVEGEPYPGEDVRLNATVAGVPMRDATVTVDGEAVGATDDRGFYNLTVPDDGTESVAVSVSRGPFAASETIDVLLLSIGVSADALVPLPGGSATVEATVGDRPEPDVRVTAAGDAATTDAEGQASIQLPGDPLGTVRAAGHGQTVSTAVWHVYLPTVAIALLLVGLVASTVAASARGESGPGVRSIAAAWIVALAFVAATILAGDVGALTVAALLAVGLLVRYRSAAWRLLGRLRTVPLAVLRWSHDAARWLADWLGRAVDRAGAVGRALLARLRSAPGTVGGLVGLVLGWLATVPGRLARWLAAGGRQLVSAGREVLASLLGPRAVGSALAALALVAGGYVLGGSPGAVLAIGVVLVGLLALAVRRRRRAATSASGMAGPASVGGASTAGDASEADAVDRPSLRDLWRTFARWVVPGRWRSRTPGEVGRAAVDRGLPREPVEQLTEVFREVEYGDRRLSEERWGRARAAFDALRTSRDDEEAGER